MKKNNALLSFCLLFSIYSCDSCMDNAEVSKGTRDRHEHYDINTAVYKKNQEDIRTYCEKIFEISLQNEQQNRNDILEKILPKTIDEEKNRNDSFFYVNNDIVLLSFFRCCLQEKIYIDLLIEKLDTSLEKEFKDVLKDGWAKIVEHLENLARQNEKDNKNQIMYNNIFELNKIFNNDVLKKILPSIIKVGKVSHKDWEKFKDKETMWTVAQMLLSEIMVDENDERASAILEKWDNEVSFLKDKI